MRNEIHNNGNYFELVEGDSYSADLLTFNEFLREPDSKFFFSDDFFQIPQYEREILGMDEIPDYAREAVRRYVFDEFEDRLLGMDDYRRWGRRFKQKCEELAVPFWSQVNMQSIMRAAELEMDENTNTQTRTHEVIGSGGQKSTVKQTNEGKASDKQLTDTSSRTATRTTVSTDDIVSEDMTVDWSEAADKIDETRTKAGEMQRDTNSSAESITETSNDSTQRVTDIASASSEYTNKQFMQERRWAIETAQGLLPKAWLRTKLAGMFYLLR
jgi:hypothetical protein